MSLTTAPGHSDDSEPSDTWNVPIGTLREPAQVEAGVRCTAVPTDGFVALTIPGPNGTPLLELPKTRIPQPTCSIGIQGDLPAGFAMTLTVKWWRGKGALSPHTEIWPYLAIRDPWLNPAAGTTLQVQEPLPENLLPSGPVFIGTAE